MSHYAYPGVQDLNMKTVFLINENYEQGYDTFSIQYRQRGRIKTIYKTREEIQEGLKDGKIQLLRKQNVANYKPYLRIPVS